MAKDLHASAFDHGTLVKLSLFRAYLREWLPVFLASKKPRWTTINLFDFFAGPGEDPSGGKGSPLIALEELFPYSEQIRAKGLCVNLYLNELKRSKFEQLERVVPAHAGNLPVKLHFSNLEFGAAFDQIFPSMAGAANLVFLDQPGVKQVTEPVFKQIVSLQATDFLFFVASSFFRRFCELEAFQKYVQIPREHIDARNPNDIHRLVVEYYRSLLPTGRPYYLAPFSIRKGTNIYGLIFGSGSTLGIEKFLRSCWKEDPERGEANFDIDDDRIMPATPFLFEEMNRPRKQDVFERHLKGKVLSGDLETDRSVYLHTLESGFLPKHGKAVIMALQKAGEIERGRFAISKISMNARREPVRIERTKKTDSGDSS